MASSTLTSIVVVVGEITTQKRHAPPSPKEKLGSGMKTKGRHSVVKVTTCMENLLQKNKKQRV